MTEENTEQEDDDEAEEHEEEDGSLSKEGPRRDQTRPPVRDRLLLALAGTATDAVEKQLLRQGLFKGLPELVLQALGAPASAAAAGAGGAGAQRLAMGGARAAEANSE